MKTFKITFYARFKDAIGITELHTAIIQADHENQARLKLYDNYEHVSIENFEEITDHEKI